MSATALIEAARDLLAGWGYLGVAVVTLTEAIVLVVPSQITLPLFGFLAGRGDLDLLAVIAIATVCATISTLPWYAAGRRLGRERVARFGGRWGRRAGLTPEALDTALGWFHRWGIGAVIVGRFAPGTRTMVCLVAGMAGLSPVRYLAGCGLGTLIWTATLAGAGALLGQNFSEAAGYLGSFNKAVLSIGALVVAWLLLRYVRRRRRHA